MSVRLCRTTLALVLICLPLGAAPCEWSAGLALLVALAYGRRTEWPLVGPVLAVSVALLIPSLSQGSRGLIAALGQTWPLVLLVALPPILSQVEEEAGRLKRLETVGISAAAVASAWAFCSLILSGTPPWVTPANGFFSHHLTLGYALVPAAAIAAHRRSWTWTALISLGILCAGSSGPILALAIVLASVRVQPWICLLGGTALALAIMMILSNDPELLTRLTHWTAGAQLILDGGAGWGPGEAVRSFQYAESQLSESILPERHAHDSMLQWGILGGLGAWLAWVWLLHELWKFTGTAGRGAIAALCVGALTQDVFGDLEVLRALCAWTLLSRPTSSHLLVSARA